MKVSALRSRTAKKVQNSLFLECKTSVSNNLSSIEYGAMKFACSVGFLDIAE